MYHHFWYQESAFLLMHLPDTVGTAVSNWKASCDPGYGVDRVAPTAEVNSTNYCNEEKTQKTWG